MGGFYGMAGVEAGYLFNRVREHAFEGFDVLEDVVDVLLLVFAKNWATIFGQCTKFNLEFPAFFLVEGSGSFFFLVEFTVINLLIF